MGKTKCEDKSSFLQRAWPMYVFRPFFLIPAAILIAITVGALTYRASRFAGIPPIAQIVDREAAGRIEIEPDQNAFTFYERAFDLIPETLDDQALGKTVGELDSGEAEWGTVSQIAKSSLETCEELLAEWRRGTKLERGVHVQPEDLQIWVTVAVQKSRAIQRLALLKSAQCLHEGNPGEAWQWLRAVFRFSRHLGNPGTSISRTVGAAYHSFAREQFVIWASHKSVTAEHLQRALIELRELNELTPDVSVSLKSDYLAAMNLLSSSETVREYFYIERLLWDDSAGHIPQSLVGSHLFLTAEPQLGQQVLRHVLANHLSQCDLPRSERRIAKTRVQLFRPTGKEKPPLMDTALLNDAVMRSMMAGSLCTSPFQLLRTVDHERSRQAAYELCLTVELFRRKNGDYPETLDALVPDFLDHIPRDPYGSNPTERMLMTRREAEVPDELLNGGSPPSVPSLVIYGRGINGTDDGGDIARQTADIGIKIPINSSRDLN